MPALPSVKSVQSLAKSFSGENATSMIRREWKRLSGKPGGKLLFSKLIGLVVPYTGTLGARIDEVRESYARVLLPDRRAVRNHLKSVHAIAMANLVELTANLAVLYSAPDDSRMIPTRMTIEWLKKGRGTLVAECTLSGPIGGERKEYENEVLIRDGQGDLVARGVVRSLIGPKRKADAAA
jgi:acyl-coenzyme A thioesterase PaaI-like protein